MKVDELIMKIEHKTEDLHKGLLFDTQDILVANDCPCKPLANFNYVHRAFINY